MQLMPNVFILKFSEETQTILDGIFLSSYGKLLSIPEALTKMIRAIGSIFNFSYENN